MMNWEGCDRGLIEELSRILPGSTEKNLEKYLIRLTGVLA
jgi:hypothetical protein